MGFLAKRAVSPLEILPAPGHLVDLTVNHVAINSWVVRIELWPGRADTAGSGTPLARRCEVWECRRRCTRSQLATQTYVGEVIVRSSKERLDSRSRLLHKARSERVVACCSLRKEEPL